MLNEADLNLLRSAQRALLGQVTPAVRSVSFDIDGKTVLARAVFERTPSDVERELISEAFTYVIADYVDEVIKDQFIVSDGDLKAQNLRLVAYERHEPNQNI